jgi:predicted protein tyrosine phosphatase
MPTIHVCPLHLVPDEAARLQPSRLVTLLSPNGAMPERPSHLRPDAHLTRLFHDISSARDDLIVPTEADVQAVIDFGRAWDRRQPILIHCYAGISRSTAAAFIIAADLNPTVREMTLARRLRAASPTATPNPLMIEMADDLLGRKGRMILAIEEIGYGEFASHGDPFELSAS